ncbi:hypothetical protein C2E23DRAFT_139054 [Lenzites betulinus]|nr:hypothetical protein C2E23DRAFT_139054 [Lenzites betulinus]
MGAKIRRTQQDSRDKNGTTAACGRRRKESCDGVGRGRRDVRRACQLYLSPNVTQHLRKTIYHLWGPPSSPPYSLPETSCTSRCCPSSLRRWPRWPTAALFDRTHSLHPTAFSASSSARKARPARLPHTVTPRPGPARAASSAFPAALPRLRDSSRGHTPQHCPRFHLPHLRPPYPSRLICHWSVSVVSRSQNGTRSASGQGSERDATRRAWRAKRDSEERGRDLHHLRVHKPHQPRSAAPATLDWPWLAQPLLIALSLSLSRRRSGISYIIR